MGVTSFNPFLRSRCSRFGDLLVLADLAATDADRAPDDAVGLQRQASGRMTTQPWLVAVIPYSGSPGWLIGASESCPGRRLGR